MTDVQRRLMTIVIAAATAAFLMLLFVSASTHRARAQEPGQSEIAQGYAIAPVPLDLMRKNRALVGLGSYIVNAQAGCNDCHTWPNFANGGDPYQGQPEQINTAGYLAGGRPFGPGVVSRDITPYENGMPAGLTLAQFISVIRTGHDPDNPGQLLQVMPWPEYRYMTDRDLAAVYEYLRSIPPIQPAP